MRENFVNGLAQKLISKRGAWAVILISTLLMLIVFGAMRGFEAPARTGSAPANSDSVQVSNLLTEFPESNQQSLLLVAVRDDGQTLTQPNIQAIQELPQHVGLADKSLGPVIFSQDGDSALITTEFESDTSNTVNAETIKDLRNKISAQKLSGMTVYVTGGPSFAADVAAAFEGADFTLLLVTIVIVAILLIATYRSPILWLIPLLVVILADGLAGRVTALVGSTWGLEFDSGIISVLVFGAGTNYALLLISRYREELAKTSNDRFALQQAYIKSLPAILASNVTVVVALLTLNFARIPLTKGLGTPAAIGLVIAMISVLTLLPALLSLVGRRAFWPFVPQQTTSGTQGRWWRRIAQYVSNRPVISLLAGLGVLAILTTGLWGTSTGLTQLEKFTTKSESALGLEKLSDHFDPGEAQPIVIVAEKQIAHSFIESAQTVDGLSRMAVMDTSNNGELVKIRAISEFSPGSAQSLQQIVELRKIGEGFGESNVLIGGAVATDLDAQQGNQEDLWFVIPAVLVVSLLILLLLLRSLIAPILLILVNTASAVAAIGFGAWLCRVLFNQGALDLQVPILAFLFLVALGIDYTIFLVHRAKFEAERLGTVSGMIEAVAHTGGVITSAGIVLAAVFAALGVLPLVTLGQLGIIVGVGVVIDTLVVRTFIVPALFSAIGDRIWWPHKLVKNDVAPSRSADVYR